MVNGTLDVSSTLQDRRNTRQYGVETGSRAKLPRGRVQALPGRKNPLNRSERYFGPCGVSGGLDLVKIALFQRVPWGASLFLASC